MKRRSFVSLLLALAGVPFLPKAAAKPAFSGKAAPASSFPVGSIQIHSGSLTPDGWIACNGQWLRAEDWPELAQAIGTGGKTVFQVPQCNASPHPYDPGKNLLQGPLPVFHSLQYLIKAK